MKFVSYTRTTCFDPTTEPVPQPITVQSEHIREYMKMKHWKLSARYSDRKNDPEASDGFQEMKRAAINRQLDCIVVDSMTRFGPDVYQTIHFLRKTYYPSGMHFVVVEDDFCSMDHSSDEVYSYLDEKRAFIHGRMAIEKMSEASIESYFSCYGFLYSRDTHRVEKDEASAKIIVEIYQRLKDGELPIAIARDMTKRGVENPTYYYARQLGRRPRTYDTKWTSRSVSTIARNPKYIGKWDFKYDIRKLEIRCGAIVDPELFEAVQEVYRERFSHTQPKKRIQPYTKIMWDKESGMPITYFNNTRTKHNDVRFEYPKEKDISYDRPYMPYDEFHKRCLEQLIRERAAAEIILSKIVSEEGQIRKRTEMQIVRDRFPKILSQMTELETEKMARYKKYQKGEINQRTFRESERVIAKKLRDLDDQTDQLIEELANIEKAFSSKNPWIKSFIGAKEDEAFIRTKVLKRIDRLLIYRFESVELVPKELKWKQALPAEWLEDAYNGKNE